MTQRMSVFSLEEEGWRLPTLSSYLHGFRRNVQQRRNARKHAFWRWKRMAMMQAIQFEVEWEVHPSLFCFMCDVYCRRNSVALQLYSIGDVIS